MNAKLLHTMQHALGLDPHGRPRTYGYTRNVFVTGSESIDYPDCMELVRAGLMTRSDGNAITGGDWVFRVTDAGREAVAKHSPPAPPITRSQQRYLDFLSADSGLSFRDWLTMKDAQ